MIYKEKCDAVYLMARDANIPAVRDLRDDLGRDALVEEVATYEYALRPDFKARFLHRERAIIVALRRRRVGEEPAVDDGDFADVYDEEIEVYDVEQESREGDAEPAAEIVPAPAPVPVGVPDS
jgi:hypothetical protein